MKLRLALVALSSAALAISATASVLGSAKVRAPRSTRSLRASSAIGRASPSHITWILSVFGALAIATSAAAAPPGDLDSYVARAMKIFGPPGMAISIVEGDRIYARAYGVRKLGAPEAVDIHTRFPIASNTKAFTAATLAVLVDEKKLSWDDRVVDRLPGFQMYDAYASHEMTVRDLLTHRSGLGLGEGDLMFVPTTDRGRNDIVRALRYLKPATSFRSVFAYDNVLYTAADALVESVSGERWDDFVRRHIFVPAGMHDSTFSYDMRPRDTVALHGRISGPIRGLGPLTVLAPNYLSRALLAAGGIRSSAVDMATWLRIRLAHGALGGGRRLFSEAASGEMSTPQTVVPIAAAPLEIAMTQPNFQGYALGSFVQDYRGHKIITHSGATAGAVSVVAIVPEKNVAIAVMINSEDSGARWSVFYHLLDCYLGLSTPDWSAQYKKAIDRKLGEALASITKAQARTHPESGPSLPFGDYASVYRDPWYGTVTIYPAGKSLHVRFDRSPGMDGALEHVQYDTFRIRWRDRSIEDAYMTFSLDAKGAVESVKMQPVSPAADFSFDYQDLHLVPVPR
jgi:CubicO group peptidase (beta-lactamase class C family)